MQDEADRRKAPLNRAEDGRIETGQTGFAKDTGTAEGTKEASIGVSRDREEDSRVNQICRALDWNGVRFLYSAYMCGKIR